MKLITFKVELQGDYNIGNDSIEEIVQILANKVRTAVDETGTETKTTLLLDY